MDARDLSGEREGMERQLAALRAAARYRNPETGRRHFAHIMPYRPHFVTGILELRRLLRTRK